jgi:hypothetical protein
MKFRKPHFLAAMLLIAFSVWQVVWADGGHTLFITGAVFRFFLLIPGRGHVALRFLCARPFSTGRDFRRRRLGFQFPGKS